MSSARADRKRRPVLATIACLALAFTSASLPAARGSPRRPTLTIITEPACSACVELERTLATDDTLRAWLDTRFDVVRVDGTRAPALLEHQDVMAHPTVLVLDESGAEIDRLEGRKDPAMLRVQLERVLALPASESSVRERFARHPHGHEERGNELWIRGRPDEAAACYVRALQDPVRCARADWVERARVLRRLFEAERFADDATCSLLEWRDVCIDRLLAGTALQHDEGDALEATRLLGGARDALAVWERLASGQRLDRKAKRALWPLCCARLVELGRDGELLDAAQDPHAALDRLAPRVGEYLRPAGTPMCGMAREILRGEAVLELARLAPLYTAALRTEAMDWVRAIESDLVPMLSFETYPILVRAAMRAGDREYARRLMEGARRMYPEGLPTKELEELDAELARRR